MFEFECIIGKGGFSKVWRVKLKKNEKKYALKEMSKVKIIDKKCEKSILEERDLLIKLKHPFIANMICSFQDYNNLYLLLELLPGGDLRYHLNTNHRFSENVIRFFISCLILSLEYIHKNNIIHHDIKPENLVCDDDGFVHLTDFGIAKIKKLQNNSETSGTPGYIAPEVLLKQNHSFTVDYYAIGIIGYEFLIGKRPYIGKNRKEIKNLILNKEVFIDENNNKDKSWSKECLNFINRCLKRDAANRLGYQYGVTELKTHPWFEKYDWLNLYNKKIIPPFIPKNGPNYNKKYVESDEKISITAYGRYKRYMSEKNYMKIFEGFTFFKNDEISNTIKDVEITKESTFNKGNNKQELYDNRSYRDIHSIINDNKITSMSSFGNKFFSSKLSNKDNHNEKSIISYKEIDEKNVDDFFNLQKKNLNKKNLIKIELIKKCKKQKQKSVDILKGINNRETESCNKRSAEIDSNDFREYNNNNLNLIDNSQKTKNNINIIKKNNSINNIINKSNELKDDIKIKKRNNAHSNSIEKKILSNNEKFSNNKNVISMLDFQKFKKQKLNIHSLQIKDSNNKEEKKDEDKIIPIQLPLLKKTINNINNKNKNNSSLMLFSYNIKHFNFEFTKTKKKKHFNFNRNKIIENNNNSFDHKPFAQFISRNSQSNIYKINENNISQEQKSERFNKIVDNEKFKHMKIQQGRSQSIGIFPIIK